jgi:hypothetical protein
MKKTFSLTHAKIKTPRLIEAAKHEVKKYLRRERNKSLIDGADFWDFDCRYGATEENAQTIHLSTINKNIDDAEQLELKSFYLEILAKPGRKPKNSS